MQGTQFPVWLSQHDLQAGKILLVLFQLVMQVEIVFMQVGKYIEELLFKIYDFHGVVEVSADKGLLEVEDGAGLQVQRAAPEAVAQMDIMCAQEVRQA